MKWYEIVGLVTIIGILGLAVTLGINPAKDEILPESPHVTLIDDPAFLTSETPKICTEDMMKYLAKFPHMFLVDNERFGTEDEALGEVVKLDDFNTCVYELLKLRDPIPQHPNKITGKYAEAICEISKIPCPENVEFEGYNVIHGDSDIVHKDYLGYNFISKKLIYHFRIIDEQLVFREQILVNGTWPAGDWMIWSFDGAEPLPAPYNIFLIKK